MKEPVPTLESSTPNPLLRSVSNSWLISTRSHKHLTSHGNKATTTSCPEQSIKSAGSADVAAATLALQAEFLHVGAALGAVVADAATTHSAVVFSAYQRICDITHSAHLVFRPLLLAGIDAFRKIHILQFKRRRTGRVRRAYCRNRWFLRAFGVCRVAFFRPEGCVFGVLVLLPETGFQAVVRQGKQVCSLIASALLDSQHGERVCWCSGGGGGRV